MRAEYAITQWILDNDGSKILDLSCLGLHNLPYVPETCQILYCYTNYLKELPNLDECVILSCCENKLTELPPLPNCKVLDCTDNCLTELPYLPVCKTVYCSSNKYLHISAEQAYKYDLVETPNYARMARIIQRAYRRHMKRKYFEEPHKYLCKNVANIIRHYVDGKDENLIHSRYWH
jgi:Leucine-rich repeat (LRR) protein